MKTIVYKLFEQLSIYFPDTPFTVQYWTGEASPDRDGQPMFIFYLHNLKGAKPAFAKGTLGLGEVSLPGDIDVAGDLPPLLKFQTRPVDVNLNLSFREKLGVILTAFLGRKIGWRIATPPIRWYINH